MVAVTRRAVLATLAAAATLRPAAVFAGPTFLDVSGFAASGHDVVAYFDLPARAFPVMPVQGSRRFISHWSGASYAFANEGNLQRFMADPERYAPQFDGHCAWAASEGYKAPASPAAWSIRDGKLYLNYSHRIRKLWEKDSASRIVAANGNWLRIGRDTAATGNGEDYRPGSAPRD
jgi:YHS domain-containing protein